MSESIKPFTGDELVTAKMRLHTLLGLGHNRGCTFDLESLFATIEDDRRKLAIAEKALNFYSTVSYVGNNYHSEAEADSGETACDALAAITTPHDDA